MKPVTGWISNSVNTDQHGREHSAPHFKSLEITAEYTVYPPQDRSSKWTECLQSFLGLECTVTEFFLVTRWEAHVRGTAELPESDLSY